MQASSAQSVELAHYISFRLGKELYALDLAHAREIVDAPVLTRIPNAPSWLPGIMNLRGRLLPVVDLKTRFELAEPEGSPARKYVVVVDVPGDEGDHLGVGMLVDAVLEVFETAPSALEPPPKFGARFSRTYLLGMTTREQNVIAVMDAAKVLADTDVQRLAETEGTARMEDECANAPKVTR